MRFERDMYVAGGIFGMNMKNGYEESHVSVPLT